MCLCVLREMYFLRRMRLRNDLILNLSGMCDIGGCECLPHYLPEQSVPVRKQEVERSSRYTQSNSLNPLFCQGCLAPVIVSHRRSER
jgi:hypothetical protein